LIFLLGITAFVFAVNIQDEAAAFKQFAAWQKKFKKTYSSNDELLTRFQNFKDTLARVEKKNSNSKGKAFYAPDKFADLSRDEFSRQYKLPKIPAQTAVTACLATGIDQSLLDLGKRTPNAVPDAFDWRTLNKVTPVKDQAQCGSCWTFSTTGAIESAYAIKQNISATLTLSEQAIVDCSHSCSNVDGQSICNQGCNGGWMWTALYDVITWNGLPTETAYPYTGVDGSCKNISNMKLYAKPKNFTCLSGPNQNGPAADETSIMPAVIMANGPLSIALNADLVEDYYDGIIDPFWPSFECDPTSLDHAVLIVGWGIDDSILGNTPYWIVKNSWGGDWGENGYFRIYRGDNVCGLANAVMTVVM